MALSPLAGKPAPPEILIDVDRLLKQYVDRKPDPRENPDEPPPPPKEGRAREARPRRSPAARQLRHERAPRESAERIVQRGAHRRDDAGDLRASGGEGDRRPALPRHGHARRL